MQKKKNIFSKYVEGSIFLLTLNCLYFFILWSLIWTFLPDDSFYLLVSMNVTSFNECSMKFNNINNIYLVYFIYSIPFDLKLFIWGLCFFLIVFNIYLITFTKFTFKMKIIFSKHLESIIFFMNVIWYDKLFYSVLFEHFCMTTYSYTKY